MILLQFKEILTDHRHFYSQDSLVSLCLIFKAGKTGNKIFSGVEFFSLLLKEQQIEEQCSFILKCIDPECYS